MRLGGVRKGGCDGGIVMEGLCRKDWVGGCDYTVQYSILYVSSTLSIGADSVRLSIVDAWLRFRVINIALWNQLCLNMYIIHSSS